MQKYVFNKVKKLIPRISETELTALRSGTTSLDREIFKGHVTYPERKIVKYKFPQENITSLIEEYGNVQQIYPNAPYNDILEYIGKKNFLSFIIPEKYGGTHLSVSEISSLLTQISSVNPALGIAIMVPNSLGPAELIQHYGTVSQKKKYLPNLANGTYIPCFGLTGPTNGSDATGTIDEGIIKMDANGNKFIHVTINKRYITLSPVANLIGLAIKVKDPDSLLSSSPNSQEGVTVALIHSDHPGLLKDTHHNPLNVGFPNGTLKGTLDIPVSAVIGGENNIGHGWKMLMECLAAGRGICLPATAKASSNTALLGMFRYASHRTQFKMPIVEMEGIQQKLADMLYHTWVINTSISLTNNLLDSGEKPAVISAIMKQQTTDRAREVLNHAMDIHAGSAICIGNNNFLEKFYKAAPIGITVEGSNTLTKNLIIFGQGLNKSHPYISSVLESILNNDVTQFNKEFTNILIHSVNCYMKSIVWKLSDLFSVNTSKNGLDTQTLYFANLANFIALKGGKIKGEQMVSSDMADLLSNLYLGHSVEWFHRKNQISKVVTKYCLNRLYCENQRLINRIIDNQPEFKSLLSFMKSSEMTYNYNDTRNIVKELQSNRFLLDELKKDILIKETPLEKLEQLSYLDRNSDKYKKIYQEIIQVGEFVNPTTLEKQK